MVPVRKPQHLGALKEVLHPYHYLLCIDLEATCDEDSKPGEPPHQLIVQREDMEAIEIGLTVIDLSSLKVIDQFQSFVRPSLHPALTDFCRKLTTIKQSDVDAAPGYTGVAQMLDAFLAAYQTRYGARGGTTTSSSFRKMHHVYIANRCWTGCSTPT